MVRRHVRSRAGVDDPSDLKWWRHVIEGGNESRLIPLYRCRGQRGGQLYRQEGCGIGSLMSQRSRAEEASTAGWGSTPCRVALSVGVEADLGPLRWLWSGCAWRVGMPAAVATTTTAATRTATTTVVATTAATRAAKTTISGALMGTVGAATGRARRGESSCNKRRIGDDLGLIGKH